jgi:diguanylate cyclase (GGDEF)-like protein/PAS domain S-box-containing protein
VDHRRPRAAAAQCEAAHINDHPMNEASPHARQHRHSSGVDGGLFQALFEAAPDAMFFVDERGLIRRANSLAHEMFRWNKGELIGRSIDELVPEGLRGAHAVRRGRYAASPVKRGMGVGLDLLAQRADGTQLPVDISLSPVQWRGRHYVIAAVRDITERRRIESALEDALREYAMRDPLTGLFNRRVLDETLQLEFARARRSGAPLAIIMADIDRFKRINDEHGHACGDAVLRRLALLLQMRMRAGDLACRYGGEEFTMIMPGCSIDAARERAESIQAVMHRTDWSSADCTLPGVTASFGVAAYPLHGETPEAVLRAADQALLEAKRAGRDRVVLAGDQAAGDSPPAASLDARQ